MKSFFTKLAMLAMFVLAVVCGWCAIYMVFDISLWNILLGILAAFFMFRALELVDRTNGFGPHADSEGNNLGGSSPKQGPRQGESPQEIEDTGEEGEN